MNGIEVTLPDMLNCREARAFTQHALLEKYHRPLLSFSMNIPGPVKTNPDLLRAFSAGKQAILSALTREKLKILSTWEKHEKTGDELIYVVDADAEVLKSLAVAIEECHPYGRLFDIDILGLDGQKLSRLGQRSCLICSGPAQDCAHSRRHSVSEMQAKVEELLSQQV